MASYPTPYFEKGAILGALYGCLGIFFVLAAVAVPLMMRYLKNRNTELKSKEGVDFWFTARNSQPWYTVALSFCATGAGAWLLYTPGEAAYLGGWWGVIGYTIAMGLGPLFMVIFGPEMRRQCKDGANITDWVADRFGSGVHVWVCLVFVYYMFIYMTGQMKTMGDMVNKYTGSSGPLCPGPEAHGCTGGLDPLHGILPLAIITVVYTLFGGLPASIMTDQIQALAIILIVIIISIFVFAKVDFDQDIWANEASVWTDRGFEMGCSLCLAVFGAEVFNLALWQRVFSAKDDRALRIGISVGAGMVCFLTFLFGVVGLLLKAQMHTQGRAAVVPAFIVFEVNTMESTTGAIRMFMFILSVCMITSCVDSFQIGITSVITRFTQKRNMSYTKSLIIGMVLTVLINVPAVAFATHSAKDINEKYDGLAVTLTDLFSMADIITITVVAPVFAGLGKFATTYGCIAGCAAGVATIVLWGWVEFGTFIAGVEMLTMMCFSGSVQGGGAMTQELDAQGNAYRQCGFYSKRSPKIFSTILVVTFVATFAVSWMERLLEKLSAIADSTQGKIAAPDAKIESAVPETAPLAKE